jgi:hypothetical protein
MNIYAQSTRKVTNEFFEDQNRDFYFEGLNKVDHRWVKCIGVERDSIEKYM